jgi:hypothetical protein
MTQHKHGDGDDKTNKETTYRMKTKGKEGATKALAFLTIINLHILFLFYNNTRAMAMTKQIDR